MGVKRTKCNGTRNDVSGEVFQMLGEGWKLGGGGRVGSGLISSSGRTHELPRACSHL